MNPDQIQQSNPQQGDPAANLGFATNLSQAMQPKSPQGSQEAQNAPGQEQTQEPKEDISKQLDAFKTEIMDEMKSFQKDTKKDIKTQIDGLRQDIKSALEEEDAKET